MKWFCKMGWIKKRTERCVEAGTGFKRMSATFAVILVAAVGAANAGQSSKNVRAKDAAELFNDYCVRYRHHPDQLVVAVEKVGARLSAEDASPFMLGQRGSAWRMSGGGYILTVGQPPYSRCRLHILSPPKGDIQKAFTKVASDPPKGAKIRTIPYVLPRMLGFVWTENRADTGVPQSTSLSLYPPPQHKSNREASLWPDATHWVLNVERDFDDDGVIFDGPPPAPPAPPKPAK